MGRIKNMITAALAVIISLPVLVMPIQAKDAQSSSENRAIVAEKMESFEVTHTVNGSGQVLQLVQQNQTANGTANDDSVDTGALIAVSLGLFMVSALGGCALYKKR